MGASLQGGSSRGNRRQRNAVMSEINVTPFVDVMLVLLIIFMVTAPMLTAGVAVDLPKSNARALAGEDEPISVSIQKNGDVYLQKRKIDKSSELIARLKAITGENAEARIFIRAAKSLDYGKVVSVMGQINAAGYRKVALVTDKLK